MIPSRADRDLLGSLSETSFSKILRILGGGIWRGLTDPFEITAWVWGGPPEGDPESPYLPGLELAAGVRWENSIYPPDLPAFQHSIESFREDSPATEPVDYRIILEDGELLWLRQWLLERRRDDRGGRTAVTGLVRIVSEEKRLQWEIMRASENERSRIGQEIHDDVCQVLAGISYLTHVLHQRLLEPRPAEAAELERINHEIQAGLERTRALAHGLLPGKSDFNTLSQALRELSRQISIRFGIQLTAKLPPKLPQFSHERLLHLYRIVQEASSNSFKHGRASKIEVALTPRGEFNVLSIEDDGPGFGDASQAEGAGLSVMRNRAELLGGWLECRNSPRGGALVEVHLPRERQS